MTYDRTCPEPCELGLRLLKTARNVEVRDQVRPFDLEIPEHRCGQLWLSFLLSLGTVVTPDAVRNSFDCWCRWLSAVFRFPVPSSGVLSSLFRRLPLALCFSCHAPAYIATTEKSRHRSCEKAMIIDRQSSPSLSSRYIRRLVLCGLVRVITFTPCRQ